MYTIKLTLRRCLKVVFTKVKYLLIGANLGRDVVIARGVQLSKEVSIGDHSYIGPNCNIRGNIIIGRFFLCADNVCFAGNDHVFNKVGIRQKLYGITLLIVFGSGTYFAYGSLLTDIYTKYNRYINYNFGKDEIYGERLDSKGVHYLEYRGNRIYNLAVGGLRYILTPLPTSLAKRLMHGGGKFGFTDDLVRVIHQTLYFYIMGYIIFNYKLIIPFIKSMREVQIFVMLTLLSNLAIYSFLAFGGTHQRTKFPFQLAVFIIYLTIKKLKFANGNTGHS